jgi:hypothetical protein
MDLKIVWEGENWIHLAQDRDWWWALVNMVIILRVPWVLGNFMII